MSKKCKGCQWYNKPYWSIINPCDNCPREETNIEIITRWQDPIIEEQQKEIERLNNIINELENEKDRLGSLFYERNEENIRLNNIINELEKYINETKLEEFEKEYGRRYGKTFTQAEVIICNMILNRLQELKGDKNNDN